MLDPELYQRENNIQRRDVRDLLKEFIHLVRWRPDGEDVVMDVGCGSGDVTWDLLRPLLPAGYAKIVGVDISEKMVRYARKHYPKAEFVLMDLGAPDVPDNHQETVDHIFSFYCLHWIHDQRQAMQNIFNLLKPGGDMLVCYIASNPIYDVFLNLAKSSKWKAYMQDVHKFISPYQHTQDVEKSLRQILLDVGFDITICQCNKKWYEYENMHILQKALNAVNPFFDNLPVHMKDHFNEDYFKELSNLKVIEDNNNKMDKITFSYKLISIYASKPLN